MRRTFAFRFLVYCAIALVANPRMAMGRVLGVDVSSYQGTINWTSVAGAGETFAFARASTGYSNASSLDSTFTANMNNGTAAGVLMGDYHYAYPQNNYPQVEAAHFIAAAGAYMNGGGYLRPVLDLEEAGGTTPVGAANLTDWANAFLNYVTNNTTAHIEPIIYCNTNYASNYLNSNIASRTLWIANWNWSDSYALNTANNPGIGHFNAWSFWQYSDTGSVSGISGNVDKDVANGDINFVKSFLIAGKSEFYFDVNSTTAGSGITTNGSYTWEGAGYSSSSAGTNPSSWVEGNIFRLAAGTDAGSKNYTITANSNHTIGGVYLHASGGGSVTINGPGILTLASYDQGWYVNTSTQNLYVNATLAGSGRVVWEGDGSDGGGSLFLQGNNTFTGGVLIGTGSGINFNNNNSFGTGRITWGIAGQMVLADDVASAPVTLANPVTTMAGGTWLYVGPSAASVTFSGAWTMPSGTSTLSIGNTSHTSSKMIINGAIGGSGGALVKTGVGTLVLSGANTYTGTTTISAGTLQLGNAGTTGKLSTSSTITNNSALVFNRTNTVTQGTDFSGSAISGTGTLTQAGTGTLVLNAANTYSGKTFINAGTLSVSSDGNLGAAPGSAVLDQLTFNGGALKVTANMSLAANRGITINSSGATFSVNSGVTFTGAPDITDSAGVLTITGGGTFNTGTKDQSGTFTGSAKWLVSGGSTLATNSNNNQTGANPGSPVANFFTLDNGTYQSNTGGIAHTINSNKGFTLGSGGGTIDTSTATTTFDGVITGSGKFTKVGANPLTLSGANTYTGITTITSGTLQLGNGGTTGSLSITSAIINNANLTINRSNTVTQGTDFSGSAITGSGSLTQTGGGTLILNAANAYIGGTIVNAGTLMASGASATLGSGNVTVLGTTAGTSLVIESGVADVIDDHATLSLAGGGTPGVADQGDANLGAGVMEIVGSLLLGGVPQAAGLTYGSTASGAAVQSNEYFSGVGVVSVGMPGDFNGDGSIDASDFVGWRKSQNGGDAAYSLWRENFGIASSGSSSLLASSVPEPASALLLLLGIAAGAWRRRRIT